MAEERLAFDLKNHNGEVVRVRAGENQATAVCFLGTECPMARSYAAKLSAMQMEFDDQLHVVGVMSNRQDSVEDVQSYVKSLDVEFDVVIDPQNKIADRFGATRTPEVFLLDDELKLRYHGRVDDQYAPSVARGKADREDLKIAIGELLSGKVVSVKETRALGCLIGKVKDSRTQVADNEITFGEHVLPVLERNCIECHKSGEIGPFAMDSYDEVAGWADTMLETIDDGRMPPWHADPSVESFANSRHMPDADKQIFRDWIAGGAKEGKPVEFELSETVEGEVWEFAQKPDMVLKMRERPFVVPKDGVVEYQYFVVDPKFEEDKWIRATQVIPGSRDVVHHCIVFVRPPDGSRFSGVGWIAGYTPGQKSPGLAEGKARFVPAGSKFVFQMHYTPTGIKREDITKLGLVFADEAEVSHEVFSIAAVEQEFEIPPHAQNHVVHSSYSALPAEGELLAITPHMHYRGKSFFVKSRMAGKAGAADEERPLLNVPNYDFNWQHTYKFSSPKPLSEIDSLEIEAAFDNSSGNPFNPNPEEWVLWGDQTWEEMSVAFFEIAVPRKKASDRKRRRSDKELSPEDEAKVEKYIARALKSMDANKDGIIQEAEGSIVVRHFNFGRFDLNGDGEATQDELRTVAERRYR